MENYETEPSNIEHEIYRNPFGESSEHATHVEVPKDKSAKTIAYKKVLKDLGPGKPVVLYAAGRGTANAVSCAEIVKAYFKQPVYQITRIGQVKTIETWNPVAAGLDPLRVTRSVPIIYILLSMERLDEGEVGFQVSGRRKSTKTIAMSDLQSALAEETSFPPQSPRSPPPLIKER